MCVCVYLYRYMDLFNVTSSKFQMVSIQPFCLCKNHGGNSEEALFHFSPSTVATWPLSSLSLSSSTSSLYFSFLSFIHTETQKHLQFLHALKEMLLNDNISFSSLMGKYENQKLHLHRAICILSLSCSLQNEKFISLKGISYTSDQLLQEIGYISSNPV